jgi:hypothetical protein
LVLSLALGRCFHRPLRIKKQLNPEQQWIGAWQRRIPYKKPGLRLRGFFALFFFFYPIIDYQDGLFQSQIEFTIRSELISILYLDKKATQSRAAVDWSVGAACPPTGGKDPPFRRGASDSIEGTL